MSTRLKWATWSNGSAIGHGQIWFNQCKPSCAAGPFLKYKLTVTLTKVKRISWSQDFYVRYFSVMTWTWVQRGHRYNRHYYIDSDGFWAGNAVSPTKHTGYAATSLVRALASPGHQTPRCPELVPKNGRDHIVGVVRPSGRFTIYGGPGVYLLGTHWTSWTATTARATGKLWLVDAKRIELGSASIVLSKPKSHDGVLYYSALHITGGKGEVVANWRWYWSGLDIGWTPAT